ncbi:hypothetical protein Q1695_007435 [Nippostrongylus brasiliensis]|nr:hypothetical protein Q1695_007435 [Nippostrongylus brasiliensis]
MVKYKLTYFNGRGLAEAARQLFILADQEYEDVRLTREEFAALKPNLPFGQVPVLEIDGHEIAQSKTICRYLANIFGFAGKDAVESAIIDSLADQWTDFDYETRPWLFITLGYTDGDAEKLKKEILLPARDKFLGFITKFLKTNADSGYLVGDKITWIDVWLAESTSDLLDRAPEYLDGFPEVEAHMKKIQQEPKIKEWLARRPITSF